MHYIPNTQIQTHKKIEKLLFCVVVIKSEKNKKCSILALNKRFRAFYHEFSTCNFKFGGDEGSRTPVQE